jgi:hypothetical protein
MLGWGYTHILGISGRHAAERLGERGVTLCCSISYRYSLLFSDLWIVLKCVYLDYGSLVSEAGRLLVVPLGQRPRVLILPLAAGYGTPGGTSASSSQLKGVTQSIFSSVNYVY